MDPKSVFGMVQKRWFAGIQVLTVIVMKIQVFWDFTLCRLVANYHFVDWQLLTTLSFGSYLPLCRLVATYHSTWTKTRNSKEACPIRLAEIEYSLCSQQSDYLQKSYGSEIAAAKLIHHTHSSHVLKISFTKPIALVSSRRLPKVFFSLGVSSQKIYI